MIESEREVFAVGSGKGGKDGPWGLAGPIYSTKNHFKRRRKFFYLRIRSCDEMYSNWINYRLYYTF